MNPTILGLKGQGFLIRFLHQGLGLSVAANSGHDSSASLLLRGTRCSPRFHGALPYLEALLT